MAKRGLDFPFEAPRSKKSRQFLEPSSSPTRRADNKKSSPITTPESGGVGKLRKPKEMSATGILREYQSSRLFNLFEAKEVDENKPLESAAAGVQLMTERDVRDAALAVLQSHLNHDNFANTERPSAAILEAVFSFGFALGSRTMQTVETKNDDSAKIIEGLVKDAFGSRETQTKGESVDSLPAIYKQWMADSEEGGQVDQPVSLGDHNDIVPDRMRSLALLPMPHRNLGWLDDCVIMAVIHMNLSDDWYVIEATAWTSLKQNPKPSNRLVAGMLSRKKPKKPNNILIPWSLDDSHWVLIVLEAGGKHTYSFIDSLPGTSLSMAQMATEIEHLRKLTSNEGFQAIYGKNEWTQHHWPNTAVQNNGTDCGVFVIANAIDLMTHGCPLPIVNAAERRVQYMKQAVCQARLVKQEERVVDTPKRKATKEKDEKDRKDVIGATDKPKTPKTRTRMKLAQIPPFKGARSAPKIQSESPTTRSKSPLVKNMKVEEDVNVATDKLGSPRIPTPVQKAPTPLSKDPKGVPKKASKPLPAALAPTRLQRERSAAPELESSLDEDPILKTRSGRIRRKPFDPN